MKTMLSSFDGHSMIDIGTQAMAGIGRNTSVTGNTSSRMRRKRPISSPSGMAIDGREQESDQDAAAAQRHVGEEFRVAERARGALEHRFRRRHVEEADVDVDPVLGEDVPQQQEEHERESAEQDGARIWPRCAASQRGQDGTQIAAAAALRPAAERGEPGGGIRAELDRLRVVEP